MTPQIRFFSCGGGDTVLLEAAGEWGLIDCNLTDRSGARERLLHELDKHGVERLRFVCVTHYDADHLRGMADLLRERFSEELDPKSDGRRWFVEQIIQPLPMAPIEMALPLMRNAIKRIADSDISPEFSKHAMDFLVTTQQMLRDNDLVPPLEGVYLPTYSVPQFLNEPPWKPVTRSLFGPFEVCFLAPEQTAITGFEATKFQDFVVHAREDVLLKMVTNNAVSRVIALRHVETGQAVLFGADAPSAGWSTILRRWQQFCSIGLAKGEEPTWKKFHAVKASHHGSKDGHHRPLYTDWCIPQKTVVVVSTRSGDPSHPDQSVIDDLAATGMVVHLTCGGRVAPSAPKPGNIPGGWARTVLPPADIVVKFTPSGPEVTRISA